MSRETIFTCDRCKQQIPKGGSVRSFDFGKTYEGPEPDKRITMDLCRMCWADLLGFLGVSTKPHESIE